MKRGRYYIVILSLYMILSCVSMDVSAQERIVKIVFESVMIQKETDGNQYLESKVYISVPDRTISTFSGAIGAINLYFVFNRTNFSPLPGDVSVNGFSFTPNDVLWNEGYGIKNIFVFGSRGVPVAQIGYANPDDYTQEELRFRAGSKTLWGTLKWRLLPGAMGKTGIKLVLQDSPEADLAPYCDATTVASDGIKLIFEGDDLLDMEIPGGKPTLDPPVLADASDLLVCGPNGTKSTLVELTKPAGVDHCVWEISASAGGSALSDVATIVTADNGTKATITWKQSVVTTDYFLNAYSVNADGSQRSDAVSRKVKVVGFPNASIVQNTKCRETELSYANLAQISGSWWNADYSISNSNPTYTVTASGDYHLVRATGGCQDTVTTKVKILDPVITWDLKPSVAVNSTYEVKVTAPDDDYEVHWAKPEVTITNPYIINKCTALSYEFEVYAEKDGCRSNTLTGTTQVNGAGVFPHPTSEYGTVVCKDGTALLTCAPTGGLPPYTYKWYKDGEPSNVLSTQSSVFVKPTANTRYVVEVTDNSNGTKITGSDHIDLTYDNTKSAYVVKAGEDLTVPYQGKAVLSAEVVSGGTAAKYDWKWLPVDKIGDASAQYPMTVALENTQTYTAYVVDANNCVSNGDDQVVNVDNNSGVLAIAVEPTSVTMCADNSVQLSVKALTGSLAGATYKWMPTTGLDDATSATPIYKGVAPGGEVVVVVTKDGKSFSAKTSIKVESTSAPVIHLANTENLACTGQVLSVVNTGNVKADSYTWTVNGTETVSTDTFLLLTNVGKYDVAVVAKVNGSSCVSDAQSFSKTIEQMPLAQGLADVASCEAAAKMSFTAVVPSGATFAWLDTDRKTVLETTAKEYNVSKNGTYYLAVKNNVCADTLEVNVSLSSDIDVQGLLPLISSCGSQAELSFVSTTATAYKWLNSDKDPIPGSDNQKSITVNKSGNYFLSLSMGNCSSVVETEVILNTTPILQANAIQDACSSKHTLKVDLNSAPYHWFNADYSKEIVAPYEVTAADGSLFHVYAGKDGCVSDTVHVTVNYNRKPSLVASSSQSGCGGKHTLFVTNATGTYHWYNSDYSKEIAYPYQVTATDGTMFHVFADGGSCYSDTTHVTVDYSGSLRPTIVANKTQDACGKTCALSVISSSSTYHWFNKTTGVEITAPYIVNAVDGSDFFVYAEGGASCKNSDTTYVKVNYNTAPTLMASESQSGCSGKHTLFVTSATGTYHWYNSDYSKEIRSPYEVTAADGSQFHVFADGGGCYSDTTHVTVDYTGNTRPTLVAKAVQDACGVTHSLEIVSSSAAYHWFNKTTGVEITAPYVVGVADGTDFFAYAEGGASCKNSDTTYVKVNYSTAPTLVASESQSGCGGKHTLFVTNATGTYHWYNADYSKEIRSPYEVTAADGSQFHVFADGGSCYSDTTHVTVDYTGNTRPTLVANAVQDACGKTYTLSVISSTSAYHWFNRTTGVEIASPYVVGVADGTDFFVYAEGGASCKNSDTTYVKVNYNTAPTLVASESQSGCGGKHTLFVTNATGTYHWYNADYSKEIRTPYEVTVADGNQFHVFADGGGCYSDTTHVTVDYTGNTRPTVVANVVQDACGETHTLKVVSSSAAYHWFNETSGVEIAAPYVVGKDDGTAFYVYADGGGSCQNSDTVHVTVNYNRKPSLVASSSQSGCGGKHTLFVTNATGTYHWYNSDYSKEIAYPYQVTATDGTMFHVFADGGSCYSDTTHVTVDYSGSLRPTVVANKTQNACGKTCALSVISSSSTYHWFNKTTGVEITAPYVVDVADGADFFVYAEGGASCKNSDTTYVKVNYNTAPTLVASESQSGCGGKHTLFVTNATGTYHWYNSDYSKEIRSPYEVTAADGNQFHVFADGGGCYSDTTHVTVDYTGNTRPTVVANVIQDACGVTHSLEIVSSSAAYHWFNETTGVEIAAPYVVGKDDGTAFYVYADGGAGCPNSEIVHVKVNYETRPSIEVAAIQDACGSKHTLFVTSATGTYRWYNADNSKEIRAPYEVTAADGDQFHVFVDGDGCQSETKDVKVNYNVGKPSITVDAEQVACGNTYALQVKNYTGAYHWFNHDYSKEILSPYVVSAADGTQYHVYAGTGDCKSDAVDVTVKFNVGGGNVPVANAGDDVTVAANGSTILFGQATGGTGAYTYFWSPEDKLKTGEANNALTHTENLLADQKYSFYVRDEAGCVSNTDEVVVKISNDAFAVTATASATTICQNNSVKLDVLLGSDVTGRTLSYKWVGSNELSASNIKNPIFKPSTSGVCDLVVYVSDGTNTAVSSVKIDVTTSVAPLLVLTESFCLGDSLYVSSDMAIDKYKWFIDGTLKQEGNDDSYVLASVGTYDVKVIGEVTGGCVSDTVKATVKMTERPHLEWDSKPAATAFAGEVVTGSVKVVSGGTPEFQYNWLSPVGSEFTAVKEKFVIGSTGKPKYDFEVYAIDQHGCVSDTVKGATKIESKNPLTLDMVSVYGNQVCQNGIAILLATVEDGVAPYTYEWYVKGQATPVRTIKKASGSDTLVVKPTENIAYELVVYDNQRVISIGRKEVALTMSSEQAPIADAGEDMMVIVGGKTVLLGSASGGKAPYRWGWSPVQALASGAESEKQYAMTAALNKSQSYSLYVVDDNNCVSPTDQVTVKVDPYGFMVKLEPETATLCKGNSVDLKATAVTPLSALSPSAVWQWFPADGLSATDRSESTFTASTAGLHSIIVKVKDGSRVATARAEISVGEGVISEFTLASTGVCEGDSVKVVYPEGATDKAISYNWKINNVAVSSHDDYYVLTNVGTSTVEVVGTNNGCSSKSLATSVTINKAPVINDLQIVDSCARATLVVSASDATTYSWEPKLSSGDVDPDNEKRYVVTTEGAFEVNVMAQNALCRTEKMIKGHVWPRPSLEWKETLPEKVNWGEPIKAVVEATGGSGTTYTYRWTKPGDLSGDTYAVPMATLATYNFEVAATDGKGCQSEAKTGKVTVDGGSMKAYAKSVFGNEVCQNGAAMLVARAEGANEPCTYEWYKKGTPDLSVGSGDTLWVTGLNAAADYIVRIQDASSPKMTSRDTVSLTIKSGFTAPIVNAGPDMTVRKNGNTVLLGSVTPANVAVKWHWGPAYKLNALSDTASQYPLTADLRAEQKYTVYVTDDHGCVSAPSSTTVRVDDMSGLCLDVTPKNKQICRGNTLELIGKIDCGVTDMSNVSYEWMPETYIPDRRDTAVAIFKATATAGEYVCVLKATYGGKQVAARVNIEVKASDAPVLNLTGRYECKGDTLKADAGGLSVHYVWSLDQVATGHSGEKYPLDFTGKHTVGIYVEDVNNGCFSDQKMVAMNLGEIPVVEILEKHFAMHRDSVQVLHVVSNSGLTSGNFTYEWSCKPDGKIQGDLDQLTLRMLPLNEDVEYVFTATSKISNVCKATDTVRAYVLPEPPTIKIDTNTSRLNIKLAWAPVSDADGYVIRGIENDPYNMLGGEYQRLDVVEKEAGNVWNISAADVQAKPLMFYYVTAYRKIKDLGEDWIESVAGDTIGYSLYRFEVNATGGSDEIMALPFNISNIGLGSTKLLGEFLTNNNVSAFRRWNFLTQEWVSATYNPRTQWTSGAFNMESNGIYMVAVKKPFNLLLYGRLLAPVTFDLQYNSNGKGSENSAYVSFNRCNVKELKTIGTELTNTKCVAARKWNFATQEWISTTYNPRTGWSGGESRYVDVLTPLFISVSKNVNW